MTAVLWLASAEASFTVGPGIVVDVQVGAQLAAGHTTPEHLGGAGG